MVSSGDIQQFQETVWQYYAQHGRAMPWREPDAAGRYDPYRIMVSEIMLQQTQVARVIPKFTEFMERFPDAQSLASAPLADVLLAWSGLGYNRRAKFLQQAAQKIVAEQTGFPRTKPDLVKLPGIGPNTAGAIMAYAYNQPELFIETNIRTVFIYHFFPQADAVNDAELEPLIAASLEQDTPREWYWALMDYGTYLKATQGNLSRASRSYAKQSSFQGSVRQIRGAVLRVLVNGSQSPDELTDLIPDDRLSAVLLALENEGLISQSDSRYRLGNG